MSKPNLYTQCLIALPTFSGIQRDVVWLPASLASVGARVCLKCPNGSWQEGWEVVEVFGTCTLDELEDRRWDTKRFGQVLSGH